MTTLQYIQYTCIKFIVNTSLAIRRSVWLSPSTQPDLTRSFVADSALYPARIFLPPVHVNDDKKLFPLIICVHGGGFILNNPSLDDPLARHLADTSVSVVVSIDYRKAPQYKFPCAYNDVVEQILAVMDDGDLPLDRENVALCGRSAGGNLVLAAAQHLEIRGRLRGIIAVYPVCDFVPPFEEKMARRPDPSVSDFLEGSYRGISDLYLGVAANVPLDDVRLSPTNFQERDDLPRNVLMVGCEHDLLCYEAETMAKRLAGEETPRIATETGWRAGGVEWRLVKDQTHAFEIFPAKNPEKEVARKAAVDNLYSAMSSWMKDLSKEREEVAW